METTDRYRVAGPLCALLLIVSAIGLLATEVPTGSDVRLVAKVGNKKIVVADLKEQIAAQSRRDIAKGQLASFGAGAKEKTLNKIIDAKLFSLGAREEGLDKRPQVQRQMENLLDEFLAQRFVADLKRKVSLTDETLRNYYDGHPEEFQTLGRVRARHIVVRTQAEAISFLGKLRRGGDFKKMAEEHNIDSTKKNGGELGWVRRRVMVKPFEQVLYSLKVGAVSSIVQTSYGFYIIQVEEIEAPKPKSYDTVIPQIKEKIVQRELEAFKARLAMRHRVKLYKEVLTSIK